MERRFAKKVDNYIVGFKTAIKEYLDKNNLDLAERSNGTANHTSDFLKFVFDYSGLEFTDEDFQKRKRVKNVVPHCDRCSARRANGGQCTRRKSQEAEFCGTHTKGTPHGVLSTDEITTTSNRKIEVWVEEIKGINYYIDKEGNVYKHEDVMNNKYPPAIIAKRETTTDGGYCIPAYGI